jgi:hypothetical protein
LSLLGVFALAACGAERGESSELLEIECIGMARYSPLAGLFRLQSPATRRCVSVISDTTWGPGVDIYTPETYGMPNGMSLLIEFGDETWVSRSGTVTLPELLDDRAAGEFDVIATNQDNEELRIKGPIDFCDYLGSDTCPYGFDTTGLSTDVSFSFSDDSWGVTSQTYATECQAVIDSATGGMQVDMQLGVWKGRNIADYQVQCDYPYPTSNHFRFRTGGVTSPGSYGPWVTAPHTVGGEVYELPEVDMEIPLVYYGFSCLSDYDRKLSVGTSEAAGSSCQFTVEQGDPEGYFSLSCTSAQRSYVGVPTDTIDFTIDMPCTVIVN